ncbi:MAG TPA: site-2 protease family protein, partial [Actinomycetota bacterium]|nr:site-2 protease family protein [Actinomycetota bacterium]
RLSSKRFGVAIVALAGPVTNVLLAIISAIALSFAFEPGGPGGSENFLVRFLFTSLQLNVVLTIFNLIPIPPLDGSRILSAALPPSKQHIVFWLDRWGFILLLVFVFVLFGPVLGPVITFFVDLLLNLFGVI